MNLEELLARVASIEQRLAPIERLFQTAAVDVFLDADTEALRKLIAEIPGCSQTGICRVARARYDMSRSRAIEVLRLGAGKRWIVQAGMYNALLYLPLENADRTHAESDAVQSHLTPDNANDDGVTN
jgi:hypothetical protein